MENDRELLELAAKAAGLDAWWSEPFGFMLLRSDGNRKWSPLENDGDALRLAVKLSIPFHVFYEGGSVVAYGKKTKHHPEGLDIQELFTSDPYEATRRAIVRSAAEVGRAMKSDKR